MQLGLSYVGIRLSVVIQNLVIRLSVAVGIKMFNLSVVVVVQRMRISPSVVIQCVAVQLLVVIQSVQIRVRLIGVQAHTQEARGNVLAPHGLYRHVEARVASEACWEGVGLGRCVEVDGGLVSWGTHPRGMEGGGTYVS